MGSTKTYNRSTKPECQNKCVRSNNTCWRNRRSFSSGVLSPSPLHPSTALPPERKTHLPQNSGGWVGTSRSWLDKCYPTISLAPDGFMPQQQQQVLRPFWQHKVMVESLYPIYTAPVNFGFYESLTCAHLAVHVMYRFMTCLMQMYACSASMCCWCARVCSGIRA